VIQEIRGQEGSPQSRGNPVLLALAMLVCCGLPFLLLAAGSLTFLSALAEKESFVLTGLVVVAILLVLGIAIRKRNRKKNRNVKVSGDACCR